MTTRTRQFALLLLAVVMVAHSSSDAISPELDFHKYFVTDSLLRRQFPCSEQELECFKNLQLLYEPDGQCYSVGEQGPCAEGEIFHAFAQEAARKGGHLRGTCHNRCGDGAKKPLAATGECLTRDEVETKICRADLSLRPALDSFGRWVCEWTELPCQSHRMEPFKSKYSHMAYNGLCYPPDVFRSSVGDVQNITVIDKETSNHPVLQYFTNSSYRNREYPCTEEEAVCLQYGRILHSNGNCYIPGQMNTACDGQEYHLDWEEAMKEDGRLQGTCKSPCSSGKQPNIATGECIYKYELSNVCRWDWGLEEMLNEFGQMSCKCSWVPYSPLPPPPTLPPPASGPGLCRVPDFSNPVKAPSYDFSLSIGFRVPCSEEEHACLREGRVLVGGACHALRTQGPCAEGEELVLDKDAMAHARLRAVCKARPCPEGSVLMPIDGKCLTHQQVISRLCDGQKVSLDEFGGWQCDYQGEFPANLTRVFREDSDGSCVLPDRDSGTPHWHCGTGGAMKS